MLCDGDSLAAVEPPLSRGEERPRAEVLFLLYITLTVV